MINILVLYYSRHGATRSLAYKIAQGIEAGGCEAVLRTVPQVSANNEQLETEVPNTGDPYVSKSDLINCAGLALGSPTRFGNMAAPMKYFLDSTSDIWLKGSLINKPACVFTSSGSMHGGQESTLLTMMIPLLHQGMVIAGLPYTEPELHDTTTGGSPYGVTHVAGKTANRGLSKDEQALAIAQGKRLASLASSLVDING